MEASEQKKRSQLELDTYGNASCKQRVQTVFVTVAASRAVRKRVFAQIASSVASISGYNINWWYLRACPIARTNCFWLFGLGGFFRVLLGQLFLVGLVDKLFQSALNMAETIETKNS